MKRFDSIVNEFLTELEKYNRDEVYNNDNKKAIRKFEHAVGKILDEHFDKIANNGLNSSSVMGENIK